MKYCLTLIALILFLVSPAIAADDSAALPTAEEIVRQMDTPERGGTSSKTIICKNVPRCS